MLRDSQYLSASYVMSEEEHRYGDKVHIIDDPVLRTLLARLCSKTTFQPDINWLIRYIYQSLVKLVINHEFPLATTQITSRMIDYNEAARFETMLIDPNSRVVLVDLARAGMLPSMVCFEYFNYVMNPDNVRLDHIFINREVDKDNHVIGSNVSGHKIGGDIDNAIVIFPDPMGATGKSIGKAIDTLRNDVLGTPRKLICLHLIITPEYLKYLHTHYPEVIVYGLRFDRGLSDPKVFETVPGTYPELERGLNERQYIVPGAGGLGEIINNSYV